MSRSHVVVPGLLLVLLTGCTLQIPQLGGGITVAEPEPAQQGVAPTPVTPPDPDTTPVLPSGAGSASVPLPPPEPAPLPSLVTDLCDEPDFASADYVSTRKGSFDLVYLPGTDAEADLDLVASQRAKAYDAAKVFLGLTSTPTLEIVLSPNRLAAQAHGYANGTADPSSDHAEVLYLPGDAFERSQYGHEIAHLLSAKVDSKVEHLKFLDEGLAELLDASGRDYHRAYADQLRAGALLLNAVDGFDWWDVDGWNYGRGASFAKLLVDTWGRESFLEFWKRAAVTNGSDGRTTSLGDVVETPAGVEKALDRLLTATYGESLAQVRLRWRTALAPHLAAPPTRLAASDESAIADVIAVNDAALTKGDAALFRSTMEGFYCDSTTDDERLATAKAMVASRGTVTSKIVSIIPIGRKNYPVAVAFLERSEKRGEVTVSVTTSYYLEHFPVGWRITVQPM